MTILLDAGKNQSAAAWSTSLGLLRRLSVELPEAKVVLITFDDKVGRTLVMDRWQSSPQEVATLSPSRRKESAEAVVGAIRANLSQRGDEGNHRNDTVLLITASEPDFDRDLERILEKELTVSAVRLLGISFDSSHLPGLSLAESFSTSRAYSSLSRVAQTSGGLWIGLMPGNADHDPILADQVSNIVKTIAGWISNSTTIELQIDQSTISDKERRLTISLVNNSKRPIKDAVLFHPHRLPSCK